MQDEGVGFRLGKACIDKIIVLKYLIEKRWKKEELNVASMNFDKE